MSQYSFQMLPTSHKNLHTAAGTCIDLPVPLFQFNFIKQFNSITAVYGVSVLTCIM